MILIVNYDLHNPNRDYPAIERVLEGVDGSCIHPQGSVWLLDTQRTPAQWRDSLKAAGDSNDEYFVGRLRQSWASLNMGAPATDWLKSESRRW